VSTGTFAAFSKFHLNTSKYPNVKVVYFVGDTTFMLSGIGDLEWKCVKKLGQSPWVLFTGAQKTANLACLLCTIGGEKDHMPFAKVVGQSKIYNFGIETLDHFYGKN
jgi:hypothetical protein